MGKMGGGFQSFRLKLPLVQICTRLDLLTEKRLPTPADPDPKRNGPARAVKKRKEIATGVPVELVGEGGQLAVRHQLPPGALPDVIVWEDRFFLRNGLDSGYREVHGYHAPPSKVTPENKRKRGNRAD
jgi:hypothetical protein